MGSSSGDVGPPPKFGGFKIRDDKADSAKLVVLPLSHVSADQVVKVIQQLFEGHCKIAAEPSTNSLMIQANDGTIASLKELLEKLDHPPRKNNESR